jgi:23S rRNA (cytosine1962-C5)-methyltransferase
MLYGNELAQAVTDACVRRSTLAHDGQSAYRLFHGYAEGRPGLSIDRYGSVILVSHKASEHDLIEPVLAGLDQAAVNAETAIVKAHRSFNWDARAISVSAVRGTLPSEPVHVLENGLTLVATPHVAANNGLFLDARPIRKWLIENSRDRRVLNLFAYTGSLGVAAAVGGARRVVHLDKAKHPLVLARENHRLNGLPINERSFFAGDVYRHLPRAARSGAQFDGIVLDPPPCVPGQRRKNNPRAQDFARLTRLTTRVLAPGGWLLCFFHRFDRSRAEFESEVMTNAACDLSVLWRGTSGPDFPELDPEQKLRVTAFVRN